MALKQILPADLQGKGNVGRPDTPGVSLEEMQRILDEIPREVIVPVFNDNMKAIDAELANRYTKEETSQQIDEKVVQVGAGDMAKAVYDPKKIGAPYLPEEGDASNTTVTFNETETLAKIVSGTKLGVLFGTVSKAVSTLIDHIKGSDHTPVGAISIFGGVNAPAGWLVCNGAAVSRTAYAALFSVIGTTYGAGDTSTTFNLPSLGGRVPLGYDSNYALGSMGGEAAHLLTVQEMPSHVHTVERSVLYQGTGTVKYTSPGEYSVTSEGTRAAGGNQQHNNMQPYTAVNFIIKI